MSELSVFYRMLGIAEHIIDPSYYHILGIERQNCNAQVVRDALLERKRELRENIPGPQFVPMVLKFEADQLEASAEVLADDQKRKAYDKQLMVKQKNIQRKSRQIEAVRSAIAEVVYDDGTIDGQGTVTLAEKLRGLGVQEHNITAILGRLPRREVLIDTEPGSYSEFFIGAIALAVSEGDVDKNDRDKLLELARRLGIDEETARETLEKVAGPLMAIEKSVGASGNVSVELERDVFDDTGKNIRARVEDAAGDDEPIPMLELIGELGEEPGEYLETEDAGSGGGVWGAVFNFSVPFIAVLILTAVVILIGGKKDKTDEEKLYEPVEIEQPTEEKVPVIPGRQIKPVGKAGVADQPVSDDESAEQSSETPYVAGQVTLAGREDAKRLAKKFEDRYGAIEVSADTAFAMVLCCDRAMRLVSGGSGWEYATEKMLGGDLSDQMARWVVAQDEFSDAGSEKVDHARLTKLGDDLRSSDKLVRYRAIDKLAADGSSEAMEVLLGRDEGDMGSRKLTVSRRLRVLRQTGDVEIARAIAFRIATEPKAVTAHQMFLSLVDMTTIEPAAGGILKVRNDETDRGECSNWWIGKLVSEEDIETKRSVINQPSSETVEMAKDVEKMLAVGGYYIALASEEIAGLCYADGDFQSEAIIFGGKVEAKNGAEGEFAMATGKFVEAVAMAIRRCQKPDGNVIAVEAVEIERRARLTACDRGLQRAAVNIESAGQMLAILAGMMDADGEFTQAIEGVQAERLADMRTITNVLDEMRYHGLHNVRLMDVVIEIAKRGEK